MGLDSQSKTGASTQNDEPKQQPAQETVENNTIPYSTESTKTLSSDTFGSLQDGFMAAKNWSAKLYKKVMASGETTARVVQQAAGRVNLEEVGANVEQLLKQVPLIREFQRTQAEWEAAHISDNGDSQSVPLPWHPDVSGLTDPATVEKLRTRILGLSKQPNTFLLDPPAEAHVPESLSTENVQLAKTLLQEDPNLEKMRYMLVPKKISEALFWRNYFYRVSVLRQSFQLSAMSGADVDDSPDFVCVDNDSFRTEPPTEETKPVPKQTVKEKKSPTKEPAETPSKKSPKKKTKPQPAEAKLAPKESSELTVEEELEAELAREVDELVLVSSKPGEPDDLDRELEMELLAELDQDNSS